ncbi:LuxR family two component transcriptional regulator [Aquimarina sp. MAR_2010_214]|uniref:response regulator transcription factor n=1 Tax=Aquimarina sp. MAR_2010_214 TaxID=1250026 RepID=UPI000C7085BA|nr:response regulator transcription factor [Aquimarina sp. MAR_2010_214]PKV49961.1 LuxR family two component transcriptional regulator [Aquimarina sp. MAR_2010_214]
MINPKIFIADDHPLMLEGNKSFLMNKGYTVIGTAQDGNKAFNQIIQLQPDIAILDMDMPVLTGLEVAKAIKTKKLPVKTIILTLFKKVELIKEVGKTIDGYLLKEDALDEILNCLEIVINEGTYTSERLQDSIFYSDLPSSKIQFTPTEKKILTLISRNLTSVRIADQLFISSRTVEKHRSNIIKKIGLDSNRNSLILWLQQNPDILDT